MNNQLMASHMATILNTQVDLTWRWKDRDHNMWSPKDMRTSHLFYTLRMIWNNTLPEHMHVGKVKLYRFGSFYTERYMLQAIIHIYDELITRNNIEYGHQLELDEMRRKIEQYKSLRLSNERSKS